MRFLPCLFLLFAGAPGAPAFGQCAPDVNGDNAVDANDALILYYAYSLAPVLGTGRGGVSDAEGSAQEMSIAARSSTVVEGSPVVFVLTMGGAARTNMMAEVALSATGDFGVATGTQMVAFGCGETTSTLTVPTRGDSVPETWGTVTATIQDMDGFAFGAGGMVSVSIADDDMAVSIMASSSPVTEGSPAIFVLAASAPPMTAFTVNVGLTPTGDFGVSSDPRPVAFKVGVPMAVLTVPTQDDALHEADGAVTAMILGGMGYMAGASSTAEIVIADDDMGVSIMALSSPVAEGEPAIFVLLASKLPPAAFTVQVEWTATGDFGVSPGSQSVAFETSTLLATFSVPTQGDDIVEADGAVTATVLAGVDYAPGVSSTTRVVIADDDIGISIAASSSLVVEGEPAVFVLTASEPPLSPFNVNVGLRPTGDFGVATGTQPVAFEAGARRATLSVPTEDDELDEAHGAVTATVLGGFGYVPGASSTAELAIADDDVTISIATSSSLVVEADPILFILTASEVAQSPLTVRVAVRGTSRYGVASGMRTAVFDRGDITAVLSVPTSGDEIREDAATVTATVTTRAGADYMPGASSTVSVMVVDDDGGGFRECDVCPEMVVVPGGTFLMGNNDVDPRLHEDPQHEVTVPRFAIGRYEVTFDEWDACHAAGGCEYYPHDGPDYNDGWAIAESWGRGTRPVLDVNWLDTQEYMRWVSRGTGGKYRLPSESEWEYAARAGTQTAYHWGDAAGIGNANCQGCAGSWTDTEKTAPVGSYPPNAFGLYDMSGNMLEWTDDCWFYDYEGAPTDGSARRDPYGDDLFNCVERVQRSGSWAYGSLWIRSASRVRADIFQRYFLYGFRAVRTLD